MKTTLSIMCTALLGTSVFAQPSMAERSSDVGSSEVQDVYFGFDSAAVPADAPDLAPIARWADQHPDGMVVLDGSTDSVGTAAYNVGLAIRRAESVRAKLVGMGVDRDRIVLAIYGEDGLRHSVNALDRRVTVWTTRDPLVSVVDHTLVRGTAVLWGRPVTYAELHPSASPNVASR